MKRLWLLAPLALAGCAGNTSRKPPLEIFGDMDHQQKYKTQAASAFFSDGRATRRPVPGTVAIGQLKEDAAYETGAGDGMYVGKNPLPLDKATLTRGQERFNIYCAPCHDRAGSGHGMVPQRVPGWLPSNLHDDRIRAMADGELYSVVSQGKRTMPGYRFQVDAKDRWAIVAYVRALQRASAGSLADVPPELKDDLR